MQLAAQGGQAGRVGVPAEDGAGGVTGQRLGGQEHQDRDQDQDEDPQQQPPEDESPYPAGSEPVHDGPASSALAEPDRPEAVAEAIQVERALARLEPLDLGRVAVDETAEERNDVPAGVVLGLL